MAMKTGIFVLCPYSQTQDETPSSAFHLDTTNAEGDNYLDYKKSEALGLCEALNLEPVQMELLRVRKINPSTYIGKGQAQKIKEMIAEHDVDAVYVDENLSPIQQRNLEKAFDKKVIDRTGLILEIFSDRAQTNEGKLQVDMARLSYQKSRLVRAWTHLERQRGGMGAVGGPGERQIELDRRMLDSKIKTLRKKLEKIRLNRSTQRAARQAVPYPVIALVGYTNAGKSTLFNSLTNEKILAKDMLFATLDPTLRAVDLASGQKVILADTVGFISDLPTELVESFKATLEEVSKAAIVVHVHDISNPRWIKNAETVEEILTSLNVDPYNKDQFINIWNKIDYFPKKDIEELAKNTSHDCVNLLSMSALKKQGLDVFLQKIDELLSQEYIQQDVTLTPKQGRLRAWLHDHAEVLSQDVSDDGNIQMQIKLSPQNWARFKAQAEQ